MTLTWCTKLILGRDIGSGCRCATSLYDRDVTFELGSARMFFTATFETFLLSQKNVDLCN